MTQQEAIEAIERWLATESRLAAAAVSITPGENGAWVVLLECSEHIWHQQVSAAGEVSSPVWVD